MTKKEKEKKQMSNEFPINQNNMYSQQYPYQRAAAPASYPYPLAPQIPQMPLNYIKGRPVVSIEEARASQIDLDGSLYVFTDIGNNKIYTKQINPMTGTATLNVFVLSNNDAATTVPEYVTKEEFNRAINELRTSLTPTNVSTTQAPPRPQITANF
jgi:hypothetical protein